MSERLAIVGFPPPWWQKLSLAIYRGDALSVLRSFPDNSIHQTVTSPPYANLRSYEGNDPFTWGGDSACCHDWERRFYVNQNTGGGMGYSSAKQLTNPGSYSSRRDGGPLLHKLDGPRGHESDFCRRCSAWRGNLGNEPVVDCLGWARGELPCPTCYVCHLRVIFAEVYRVTRADGTLCLNLGNSYNGCVDEDTEALTDRGWLRYDQLREGDRIMTLNPETYLAEWGTVEKVNILPPAPRRALLIEGRGHSSLTTADHRWYVEHRTTPLQTGCSRAGEVNGFAKLTAEQAAEIRSRYSRGSVRQVDLAAEYGVKQAAISKIVLNKIWTKVQPILPRGGNGRQIRGNVQKVLRSEQLTVDDRIPIAAPVTNLPEEPIYPDAFVELIAWYYTEGSDRRPGPGRTQYTGATIHQSHKVNPENVERITKCLSEVFGPPVPSLPGKGGGPAWYSLEDPFRPGMTVFKLSAAAARALRVVCPTPPGTEKGGAGVPLMSWIMSLTQSQLDLFIETSIAADGHARDRDLSREETFMQKDRGRTDVFQIACILAGRAASIFERPGIRNVYVRNHRWIKPMRHPHKWIEYHGMVWCPTTNNGSWLARRDGKVFFTGNSGGSGGQYNAGGICEGQPRFKGNRIGNGLKPKDLILVGAKVAMALQADGWYLRSNPPWIKASCRPDSATDRPGYSHEDWYQFSKSERYYWDPDAVRKPLSEASLSQLGTRYGGHARKKYAGAGVQDASDTKRRTIAAMEKNGGRNRRTADWTFESLDGVIEGLAAYLEHLQEVRNTGGMGLDDEGDPLVLRVNPGSFDGEHYAAYSPALVMPWMKAGTSEKGVCGECGAPWRRNVEIDSHPNYQGTGQKHDGTYYRPNPGGGLGNDKRERRYLGWIPSCSCPDASIIPATVLDPFLGTGTTIKVAKRLGRIGVGIEISPKYAEMARDGIEAGLGLFDVPEPPAVPVQIPTMAGLFDHDHEEGAA